MLANQNPQLFAHIFKPMLYRSLSRFEMETRNSSQQSYGHPTRTR